MDKLKKLAKEKGLKIQEIDDIDENNGYISLYLLIDNEKIVYNAYRKQNKYKSYMMFIDNYKDNFNKKCCEILKESE